MINSSSIYLHQRNRSINDSYQLVRRLRTIIVVFHILLLIGHNEILFHIILFELRQIMNCFAVL